MAPSRGRGGNNKKETPSKSSSSLRKPKNNTNISSSASSNSSPSAPKLTSESANRSSAIPAALCQRLLRSFISAFPALLEPNAAANVLPGVLQQVKHFLYERDFTRAFGKPEYLEAYAARWSAGRSAGYCEIFHEVVGRHLLDGLQDGDALNILCLGGGSGAELVGLAGAHQALNTPTTFEIVTVDVADWSKVLLALSNSVTSSPPPIIDPAKLSHTFIQQDLLSSHASETFGTTLKSSQLTTLMFTLNELFSTSLGKTQALLLDITTSAPPGALLLVVDSPGSYSTVQLGGKEKQYPMAWMLDHVLLKIASELEPESEPGPGLGPDTDPVGDTDEERNPNENENMTTNQDLAAQVKQVSLSDPTTRKQTSLNSPKWEKILHEPSRWYRLPATLAYPIPLEDMRVQMYLYRRC